MGRDELLKSIVSGQKRGLTDSLVYPFLFLLSLLYSALIRIRNFLYDIRLLPAGRASVPVVSVGNITVGGTGKTPLVAYLVEQALERGFRPGVIARGYKGAFHDGVWLNDEGLLLKEKFPEVIVVQSPDRIAAARKAVDRMGADFIILDDAFQHRRIERDVDLLTVDGRAPFGNGRVLPAGILREPVSGVRRAGAVVLSRCTGLSEDRLREIGDRLGRLAGGAPVFSTVHSPERLRSLSDGSHRPVNSLEGQNLFLFSGIAGPETFRRTVQSLGGHVCGERVFSDHHHYVESDLKRVINDADRTGADGILTTEKDAVKLRGFERSREILVLEIAICFRGGEMEFNRLIFGAGK